MHASSILCSFGLATCSQLPRICKITVSGSTLSTLVLSKSDSRSYRLCSLIHLPWLVQQSDI
jgi:hypothetical protein